MKMSSEWIEFAKAALTGLCANNDIGARKSEVDIAAMARDQADAMMAVIAKRSMRVQK